MTRFLILDPSSRSASSHHFVYTSELLRVLRAQDRECHVYVSKFCDATLVARLSAEAVFSSSIYRRTPLPEEYRVAHDWAAVNSLFEQELTYLSNKSLYSSDTIILHTTWSNQLFGLYRWFSGLPQPRPRLWFKIHFPPSYGISEANWNMSEVLFGRALEVWKRFDRDEVVVASTTPDLARCLNSISGVAVEHVPLIVNLPVLQPVEFNGDVPTFLFAGSLRGEKGIDKLLGAIRANDRLRGMKFLLHSSGREQSIAIRNYLGPAARTVDFIEGPLSSASYSKMMGRCDAVLLPYDPAIYSLRASGIFVEAIAAARPVLVTAKTWMDRELVNWGQPGVRTRDWTIESLAEGILQLADELPIRKEIARRVAPIFRTKFTAESFLTAFSSLAVKG